ncbi:3-methylmercaptopropionyl-CoA ligase [Paraburkholderia aspalathi]|uniref:3-methylmercaptopropionyl-CoA ligase n=1 Tax=Paraburkholderia aspalathi TaxID=1324617 RepID=A0ABM8R4H1_9BURK|nr:3-(methylthio)propionyl-CoA ligase [Paraburkholderia aspalathi]MBK3818679.1 long-chain-fatty-acid--CoA ligase [Paraburkholderia aspalathi]MBK3830637.1 long-chain-fatty-acid--CoA ligase [Paraburkholderia aspalathi]MBK3860233.1 long-chain-fatty-acid--CoA ligase [Paraburkholderia aspalathi]CAE6732520.1 3-methylmercaptopropionyl-CoA ligase [Paraburkholderia aspalathi]
MQGLMMQQPLLVASLLTHAERHHGEQEIVSRRVEGDIHRYRYRDFAQRARRMANALAGLGIEPGERVGTLAWNGYRHMELYFAVSGSGSVLHTLNPRLHVDQLAYIIEHAEDRVVFFDLTFLPLIESVAPRVRSPKVFVAMTDRAHMPRDHGLSATLLCYEDIVDGHSDAFDWPLLDENSASSLCYTSGTTGNPKGVLYSHRSTLLHTYAAALPDSLNCSARDVILPVVPMFHVNAWGLPYIACMVGAKLVFPGPALDGKSLHELIENEQVTLSAGVPTVWQGLLAHVDAITGSFSSMKRTIIGGAPCPTAMTTAFQARYGIDVVHAWGMTELSPVGTICSFKAHQVSLPVVERYALQAKQGRPVFGMDMKIVDLEGEALPWDGAATGDLLVRGHWVTREYFGSDDAPPLRDGWFPTGDVARIDPDGFMQITDRSKDVIKSGGEWISSTDIENIAYLHPEVTTAVCIAARHPKWDERPLLLIVKKPGSALVPNELLTFFDGRLAKWWKPDAVVFVDSVPLGATGKVLKNRLRDQFGDYYLSA